MWGFIIFNNMGQKLIITEEETQKIIEMYNLNEAISFQNVFKDIKSSIGDSINYIKKINNYSKLGLVSMTMLLSLLVACNNQGETENYNQTAEFIIKDRWKGSDDEKLHYAMFLYGYPPGLKDTWDSTYYKQVVPYLKENPKSYSLIIYSESYLEKGEQFAKETLDFFIDTYSESEKLENETRELEGFKPNELKWNKDEIYEYITNVKNELKGNKNKVDELVRIGILELVDENNKRNGVPEISEWQKRLIDFK
jgi:hypothetical protein